MKIKISALAALALLSLPTYAYDYEAPKQAKHHEHEVNEELDAKYSKHQGTENLDQRFWVLFNEASSVVSTARDKVNTTNSFVYQNNMAALTDSQQNEYKDLVKQERLVLKKYLLLRDELLNLIFNARNAGADVDSYETRVIDLMADAKRLDKKIEDRP